MENIKFQKVSILLMRLGLGWYFLYAGITKVLDPTWSAAGYISQTKILTGLYEWFASPAILPVINFLNQWGLTLVGLALILGIWVRFSSIVAVFLMVMYYIPVLDFPLAGAHSYIVDDHVLYILGFLILIAFKAGNYWGLDSLMLRRRQS